MKIKAEKEFYKQNYEHDDGEFVVGINTDLEFNFENKKYDVEMKCCWKKGHWYSYILKDGDKIISDGMVQL